MSNPFKNPIECGLICALIVMFFVVVIPLAVRFTMPDTQGLDNRIYKTNTVYTVEHDNHLFVIYNGDSEGGIIHHPSCKCLIN